MGHALIELVEDALVGLPAVTPRRMFGCPCWFAAGRIFTLIHDHRIGVRLPEPAAFDQLFALPGAERWRVGPKRVSMSCWLLLPESMHDDADGLRSWVTSAHRQAMEQPPPAPRKRVARTRAGTGAKRRGRPTGR